ncbi:4'-phosphopantetheinyl transferase family protein [Paenibacillus wynnii]|uniref:4'-phosphopantetheinyl transferase family protein n=1 Tax=Paenibacillus wynnii TaxID=268407 RepID=UPI00278FEEEA|nr:4'-phosphopantetheinyl transferase superfamily protein [Paenibacillus wynnii]MDQ0195342.1 4'-phosphopantetheinyl transferase [Paenibacillus wynnii]
MIDRDLYKDEFYDLQKSISTKTLDRIKKFHFRADAQRTLLGDILIRYILCKRKCKNNEELIFSYNPYGKPQLANSPDIHFNISHSGKYVVASVDTMPVGVDVEIIKPIDLKVADSFFSKLEKEYILNSEYGERLSKFYRIWTMKESYIKREGKGLSIPLDSFCVISLEGDNETVFYEGFQNEEAVCTICSSQNSEPKKIVLNLDSLINNFEKTVYF